MYSTAQHALTAQHTAHPHHTAPHTTHSIRRHGKRTRVWRWQRAGSLPPEFLIQPESTGQRVRWHSGSALVRAFDADTFAYFIGKQTAGVNDYIANQRDGHTGPC